MSSVLDQQSLYELGAFDEYYTDYRGNNVRIHKPYPLPDCKGDRFFVSFMCSSCGKTYRFKLGCHSRICPTCNVDKARKLIRKYRDIDSYLENPYFVTLTVKNVKMDRLKEGVVKLRSDIRKLCNRAPYRRWFAGGLYAIEFTYNWKRNDFNLHAHCCIDSCVDLKRCDYLGYASNDSSKRKEGLKQDWFDVTGDSYIVDWQRARYPKKAISYCLKYVTKGTSYGKYNYDVCDVLYKSRMIAFFGICYNVRPVVRLPFMCECGSTEPLEFLGIESIPEPGAVYSLDSYG